MNTNWGLEEDSNHQLFKLGIQEKQFYDVDSDIKIYTYPDFNLHWKNYDVFYVPEVLKDKQIFKMHISDFLFL